MIRLRRKPGAARRRREGGYSLMEILIGLAIIALLIGVAGPRVFALFDELLNLVAFGAAFISKHPQRFAQLLPLARDNRLFSGVRFVASHRFADFSQVANAV